MRLAIIGCGLIGKKRALAIDSTDKIVACCDTNSEIAEKFGKEFSCQVFSNYKELLNNTECETIIVAVVNKFAKEIIIDSLKSGKNVIAEKPLGRNYSESETILNVLNEVNSNRPENKLLLKTGFNHRFHPAVWQAMEIVQSGEIGSLFSIRARYGHGGRPGMENEWRASKELCGGGELLDQGVHIIDLIRWFGGEVKEVFGLAETKFWKMEVEDNAYGILKTDKNVTAIFQVSWTNWKNIFSFEIFGTDGYLRIEGLGGSYGQEALEIGKRKKEGGAPEVRKIEFPPEDISWKNEWLEFKNAIKEKRDVVGNEKDGHFANIVINAIYQSGSEKKSIIIERKQF